MPTTRVDRVLAVQASLTSRDMRLLFWLADHGVLTTPQIIDALFGSTGFAQRRLLRLLDLGVVARFRPQRADGGSYPYHWILDQAGAEFVAAQRGDPLPRPGQARARRLHLTSRTNLPHLLGTNGFFTALAGHQRTRTDSELAEWWPASRYATDMALYEHGDSIEVALHTTIRPDGSGIWSEADRSVWFFLEHDTGTEPLTTLTDKIARYATLMRGKQRPFALLLDLPTARRELNLHQRLTADGTLALLPIATTNRALQAETGLCPAGTVWWALCRQGRVRLSDLSDIAIAVKGPPEWPAAAGGRW